MCVKHNRMVSIVITFWVQVKACSSPNTVKWLRHYFSVT